MTPAELQILQAQGLLAGDVAQAGTPFIPPQAVPADPSSGAPMMAVPPSTTTVSPHEVERTVSAPAAVQAQQGVEAAQQAQLAAKGTTIPLSEVADRISMGELNTVIDINTKGEIGLLAESIERMQVSIKAAIERLQKRREVK